MTDSEGPDACACARRPLARRRRPRHRGHHHPEVYILHQIAQMAFLSAQQNREVRPPTSTQPPYFAERQTVGRQTRIDRFILNFNCL